MVGRWVRVGTPAAAGSSKIWYQILGRLRAVTLKGCRILHANPCCCMNCLHGLKDIELFEIYELYELSALLDLLEWPGLSEPLMVWIADTVRVHIYF